MKLFWLHIDETRAEERNEKRERNKKRDKEKKTDHTATAEVFFYTEAKCAHSRPAVQTEKMMMMSVARAVVCDMMMMMMMMMMMSIMATIMYTRRRDTSHQGKATRRERETS